MATPITPIDLLAAVLQTREVTVLEHAVLLATLANQQL